MNDSVPKSAPDAIHPHDGLDQLVVSSHLHRSVLDALPAQIAVLDQEARLLAVNRAWRAFSAEQGRDDHVWKDSDPRTLAACRWSGEQPDAIALTAARGIEDVIQGRRLCFSIEYPCHTAQRQCWLLMRAFPLQGEQEGAVVTYLDITERRLAEEEARRARDALARVARLDAVGVLASSLVHELLQPLSAAGFYCSAAGQLAKGPSADPRRLLEVIRCIDDQVHRAGDIMERLRAFLRGLKVHRVRVPVDQVLKRALDLVRWFANDRQVRLELIAPGELPEIEGDPVQIEQVLVNLICNAVQAIDMSGCVQREVRIEVVPGLGEIEFIVRDTGPGLPPGRQAAIFDIFESNTEAGLGLGLAISRAIAEDHGGRLWAEPAPTEGAVFHFTLPTAWDEDSNDSNPPV
ncbi:sensor histidine kinase [Thermochromatium tepidum]|jgi:Signal transduction histidine kinase regulating C4-dicarboxylate transport system|uniref:histidine kinase n=1 Tax=Thermochromatium tepidum ATCC 43061 TaxID=316276 RepID=A0A6I6ECK1_THETI|nr:PAS domain-containing sensor histidine kinase [Thermochromatium tepidum]QGU32669.1 PAS domain-containing protein [Thermochromatium tepidum ATCC 43061]